MKMQIKNRNPKTEWKTENGKRKTENGKRKTKFADENGNPQTKTEIRKPKTETKSTHTLVFTSNLKGILRHVSGSKGSIFLEVAKFSKNSRICCNMD
jgi:hypothetical protein